MSNSYYPIFVDLRGRRCLVVGGGAIAQRKVRTLLGYGARVTVVSPQATAWLRRAGRAGRIRYVPRRLRRCDLDTAWLVVAATDDEAVNRRVAREAGRRRIFANIVDRQALCSFIAPAMARRGPLTLAVSTGGASPTVAKRLRDELDEVVGRRYVELIRLLRGLRGPARRRLPSHDQRKRYFDDVARGRVFDLVQRGKTDAARRHALALLRTYR